MRTYSATVLADSINEWDDRLVTLEVTFPRFILPEMTRSRSLSFSVESSRARSLTQTISEVEQHPFVPDYWGKHQKGMSAHEEVSDAKAEEATTVWLEAKKSAVLYARNLQDLGLHKQLVNRVLEPYMWTTAVISGMEDAWNYFFDLRISPDAQPEIQRTAQEIKTVIQHSTPDRVTKGGWHLPYITPFEHKNLFTEIARAVSAARCARVSYRTQKTEGNDIEKDVTLYNKLVASGHWSPLEHVAVANYDGSGNFHVGWVQLRHIVDGSFGDEFR